MKSVSSQTRLVFDRSCEPLTAATMETMAAETCHAQSTSADSRWVRQTCGGVSHVRVRKGRVADCHVPDLGVRTGVSGLVGPEALTWQHDMAICP